MMATFGAAISLKREMLQCNLMISLIYAFAVLFGLLCHEVVFDPTVKHGAESLTLVVIIKEILEFSLLACLYINVRPRTWP